jgi:hypothetical protein
MSSIHQEFNQTVTDYAASDISQHYADLMCKKPSGCNVGKSTPQEDVYASEVEGLTKRDLQKKLCVLPIGHVGRCLCNLKKFFKKDSAHDKATDKIDTSVFSTTGNDGYVYKNRASRCYQNTFTAEEERSIRDKKIKKKCGIPLKEYSTPNAMSDSYLDWIGYLWCTRGVEVNPACPNYEAIVSMLTLHKQFIINHFASLNRSVFDSEGNTICCVTGKPMTIQDFVVDRFNPRDSDVQFGHIRSSSDNCLTIKGLNTVVMSRRGNLIIGERLFTEDVWLNELRDILIPYEMK